ncbi:hypothetical protein Tco_1367271 [Tanacetum coccineum]
MAHSQERVWLPLQTLCVYLKTVASCKGFAKKIPMPYTHHVPCNKDAVPRRFLLLVVLLLVTLYLLVYAAAAYFMVSAGSSRSVPADYVPAGHVIISADRYREYADLSYRRN